MEEVANTSIIGIEPQTLELSSDLSKEVRESIAHVTRLVVKEVSQRPSFWQEKNRVLENRDVNWFFPTKRSPLLAKARSRNNPHKYKKSRKLHLLIKLRSAGGYCGFPTDELYIRLGPGQH
jgi:hypothetical protein